MPRPTPTPTETLSDVGNFLSTFYFHLEMETDLVSEILWNFQRETQDSAQNTTRARKV
jgi:hypothetical protein